MVKKLWTNSTEYTREKKNASSATSGFSDCFFTAEKTLETKKNLASQQAKKVEFKNLYKFQ
jgi:hypothetical protein